MVLLHETALGDECQKPIPSEQLSYKFSVPPSGESFPIGRLWLSFDLPTEIQSLGFLSLDATYSDDRNRQFRFPVQMRARPVDGKLVTDIFLPTSYQRLELAAFYGSNSCKRLLQARFVRQERVE